MAAEQESNEVTEPSERSNETSERRVLDDLPEDGRRRSLAWLKDRYQVATA